jgi:purine-binding chemotaxis protein CheW
VLDIAADDIEPPPAFGARIRSDFIHGMGRIRGKFVIVLDVNRALSMDEIEQLGGMGGTAGEARHAAAPLSESGVALV